MRILISGKSNSNHRKVAAQLAYRLGLHFVSAADLINVFCSEKGISVESFKEHDDVKLNVEFNEYIVSEANRYEDYVCDCIGIAILPLDGVKIFLDKELFEETTNISEMLSGLQNKDEIIQKLYGTDLYVPDYYDLFVNCTGKDVDQITEWLVDAFMSGRVNNRGIYVPAYVCVPDWSQWMECATLSDSEISKGIYKPQKEFTIQKFFCAYILHGNIVQAIINAMHNGLLYVPFDNMSRDDTILDQLHAMESYRPWLLKTGDKTDSALASVLLSKYCYSISNPDYTSVYTDFAAKGNPVKRLIELTIMSNFSY